MSSKVTSIRLPTDTLARLKRLARRRSVQSDKDVTWSELVRQAIEMMLVNEETSAKE